MAKDIRPKGCTQSDAPKGIGSKGINSKHTPKAYTPNIHPKHPPKVNAQTIRPNHKSKGSAQNTRSKHTRKAYAQNAWPKQWMYRRCPRMFNSNRGSNMWGNSHACSSREVMLRSFQDRLLSQNQNQNPQWFNEQDRWHLAYLYKPIAKVSRHLGAKTHTNPVPGFQILKKLSNTSTTHHFHWMHSCTDINSCS